MTLTDDFLPRTGNNARSVAGVDQAAERQADNTSLVSTAA